MINEVTFSEVKNKLTFETREVVTMLQIFASTISSPPLKQDAILKLYWKQTRKLDFEERKALVIH